MTSITTGKQFRSGSFQAAAVRTVIVHDGRRGNQGPPGEQGEKGDQGDGYNQRGDWVMGLEYCPLDSVVAQSSTAQGITSLFVQNSAIVCSVSNVEPKDDPGRWDEIGYTDFGDALGNLWEVEQTAHTFTQIGLHVSFDAPSGRYVTGDPAIAETAPFAVIRDIPTPDRLVLQSSGLLPNPDPTIIEGGGGWIDDRVYYARDSGLVDLTPPPAGLAVPVFRYLDGDAVVFPFESATVVPPPTPAPAPATTHLKLDDISPAFDNSTTTFIVFSGAAPIAWPASTESFQIYVDGNPQEPFADFTMVDSGGNTAIQFTTAPLDFQNFWGVYAVA